MHIRQKQTRAQELLSLSTLRVFILVNFGPSMDFSPTHSLHSTALVKGVLHASVYRPGPPVIPSRGRIAGGQDTERDNERVYRRVCAFHRASHSTCQKETPQLSFGTGSPRPTHHLVPSTLFGLAGPYPNFLL